MALKTLNFALNGASQPLSTTNQMVTFIRFENPAMNGDVLVGDANLTASNYGFTVEDGLSNYKDLGPWGGGTSPINLTEVYVRGTNGQTLHVTYVPL